MYVIKFTARNAYGSLDGKPQVHTSREYDTREECEHRLKWAPCGREHTAEIVKVS